MPNRTVPAMVQCPGQWQGDFAVSGCLPPAEWSRSGLAAWLAWAAFCFLWCAALARAARRGRASGVLSAASAFWLAEGLATAMRALDRYHLHEPGLGGYAFCVVFLQLLGAGFSLIWDCYYLFAGHQLSVYRLWAVWIGTACAAFVAYLLLSHSEAFGAGAPMIILVMFETSQVLRMFLCVAFVRGAKHGKPHRDAVVHAVSMWIMWAAHIYSVFVELSSHAGHFIETEGTMPSIVCAQGVAAFAFNWTLMALAEEHGVFTVTPVEVGGQPSAPVGRSIWFGLGRSAATVGGSGSDASSTRSWRTVHVYPEKMAAYCELPNTLGYIIAATLLFSVTKPNFMVPPAPAPPPLKH